MRYVSDLLSLSARMTIEPESGLSDRSRDVRAQSSILSISMRPLPLGSFKSLLPRASDVSAGYSPDIIASKSLRAPRSVRPIEERSRWCRGPPSRHMSRRFSSSEPASSPRRVPESLSEVSCMVEGSRTRHRR